MALEKYYSRAVAMSAEARQRTTREMWHVRSKMPIFKRLGKTGVGFAFHSERLQGAVIRRIASQVGAQAVIGHGCEQIVIPDGDNVIKFLFNHIYPEVNRAEAEAEKMQQVTDLCESHLGTYWLPTRYEATRLIGSDSYGVIARQERLIDPYLYFSAYNVEPTPETRELAAEISAFRADKGFYPDLIGARNIALRADTGRLCQIDTIPVSGDELTKILLGTSMTVDQHIQDRLNAWAA